MFESSEWSSKTNPKRKYENRDQVLGWREWVVNKSAVSVESSSSQGKRNAMIHNMGSLMSSVIDLWRFWAGFGNDSLLEALWMSALRISRYPTQERKTFLSILQRFYDRPSQASDHQGVDFIMARVYIDFLQAEKILVKYKVKMPRRGWYRFRSRRIYERVDGKFIAIGWHIFNGPWEHETYSIVVTDSEINSI